MQKLHMNLFDLWLEYERRQRDQAIVGKQSRRRTMLKSKPAATGLGGQWLLEKTNDNFISSRQILSRWGETREEKRWRNVIFIIIIQN